MADRDKSVWEAEELRSQTLRLDAALREASSRAETEHAQRRALEGQASFLKGKVQELEARAAKAALVPSLKQELGKAGQEIRRLQQCERRLQASLTWREACVGGAGRAARSLASAGPLRLCGNLKRLLG